MAVESVNTPAAPPIGVLSAVRRHWIVATLPVILLVGAAVALGLERPPRYTATANLSVGRIYVDNPAGVSGVLEATQSLAAVYSRAIRSTAVQTETARRFGRDSAPRFGSGLRDAGSRQPADQGLRGSVVRARERSRSRTRRAGRSPDTSSARDSRTRTPSFSPGTNRR